ncbi:MAG: Holliday junction resolvase RuvX [Clostridia bacterium]|nr:Holliday junction resolvase RuvX [Clostridia bacterium]MBQ8862636.1 Holliday junction resolvase RuvX [Clostridia bacterium]
MAQKAKKLLGVDYGMARTGLAHSDDLGMFAVAMGNVKSYNPAKAAVEVAAKAEEIGAETIVIGKPMNMDGTSGEKVQLVEEFAALIAEHTDIPIEFYDERLSTVSAHRLLSEELGVKAKKHKKVVDSLAAEIILQSYMDLQKNKI